MSVRYQKLVVDPKTGRRVLKWFVDKKAKPCRFTGRKTNPDAARKLVENPLYRASISNSTGCHETQVEEYREFFKRKGVAGVTVLPSGDFVYDSRNSMLNACKASGQFNANDGR